MCIRDSYNSAQNGFDYSYNVNLAGAEYMSVHVNVSKDYYRVAYYESQEDVYKRQMLLTQ